MTITLVVMQIMEELRHALLRREQPHKPLKKRRSRKRNTTRAHCAEKRRYGPTIRLIRQFLICVPAKVRELQTRIVFGLPPMPEFRAAGQAENCTILARSDGYGYSLTNS